MPTLYAAPIHQVYALLTCLVVALLFCGACAYRVSPTLVNDAHKTAPWLDGLRGLAAIAVALNHAPLVLINLHIVPKVFYFTQDGFTLLNFLGGFGVQVFFCITGLLFGSKLLDKPDIDWTSFYRHRVRRIVPAYFVVATVAIVVAAIVSAPIRQSWAEIVSSIPSIYSFALLPLPTLNGFDMGRLLGVNWTLAFEWRFYAALPFLFLAVRISKFWTLCAVGVFALGDMLLNKQASWVFFFPGVLCSGLLAKDHGRTIRRIASVALVVLLAVILARWNHKPRYGIEQWFCVSAFFAALVVAKPKLLQLRPLLSLGTISYSFYLWHGMALFLVVGAAQRFAIDVAALQMRYFVLVVSAALATGVVLASLSYLYVERPYLRRREAAARSSAFDPIRAA